MVWQRPPRAPLTMGAHQARPRAPRSASPPGRPSDPRGPALERSAPRRSGRSGRLESRLRVSDPFSALRRSGIAGRGPSRAVCRSAEPAEPVELTGDTGALFRIASKMIAEVLPANG